MRNMKLKGFLLGVFGLFLSFAAFSQEEAKPSLLDKIIAKIDNHYILKSEIEAQYQQYLASGPIVVKSWKAWSLIN